MRVTRFELAEQHDDVTRDRDAHKKALQGRSASNIWRDVNGLAVSMGERSVAVVLCVVIGSMLQRE
jgi:hypothetical protein